MRPLAVLIVAILAGASLAGCTSNADEAEPAPPTRVLPSRPGPTMPTIVEPNATFRILELRGANVTAEVGLPFQLVARAANDGPDPAPLTVAFELLGGPEAPLVLAQGGTVDAGGEGEVFANLTPPRIGNFTARASADGSEATLPIAVIGPRIAQLTLELIATEQCSDVIVKTSFRNMGDGRARNARADLSFRQMDGTKVADYATALGDVGPGQLAESEARVSELRSHCPGEEQRTYDARFTVHADGVLEAALTGVVAVRIV